MRTAIGVSLVQVVVLFTGLIAASGFPMCTRLTRGYRLQASGFREGVSVKPVA